MYKRIWTALELNKIVSVIIIHALDLLLFLILLPFMVWEWFSERPYIITILRTIIEVTLELIVLTIFAGVSILITVIFVFDDVYCSKTQSNQQKILNIALHDNDKSFHIVESSNFTNNKR
ncbi:uncharacterized protein LOC105198419 [Solenopsis invicta]|uniref:uncharacterized protein LOC105198419 n=1 Tax=Solenopsis invicta TaxID=13686 RepID=UPI00193E60B3|nr:uncharacterized protein LOC105198419 [Solenopsis invicta]